MASGEKRVVRLPSGWPFGGASFYRGERERRNNSQDPTSLGVERQASHHAPASRNTWHRPQELYL